MNVNVETFYLAPGYNKFQMFYWKIEMDYENDHEHPIQMDKSVICDDEDDASSPKHSKRRLLYHLTGLPIGRQQVEEDAKQDIHHSNTTYFNLN